MVDGVAAIADDATAVDEDAAAAAAIASMKLPINGLLLLLLFAPELAAVADDLPACAGEWVPVGPAPFRTAAAAAAAAAAAMAAACKCDWYDDGWWCG